MKILINELREIVGNNSLTEAVISDVFADVMVPITNSIARADKELQVKIKGFAERIFGLVKKQGVGAYELKFDGNAFTTWTGGKKFGLDFRPNFYVNFFHNDEGGLPKAVALIKKAFNARFINPLVETREGAHPPGYKYYIAVVPEEVIVSVADIK